MTTDEITEHKAKIKTDIYEAYLFPDGSLLYIDGENTITFESIDEMMKWADSIGDRTLVTWLTAQSVFTGAH